MVVTYRSESLETRKSQNVHFSDYLKNSLLWSSMPITVGLLSLAAGKVTHYKFFPLDGSVSLIPWAWEAATTRVIKSLDGTNVIRKIEEVERLPIVQHFTDDPEKQKTIVRDFWNFSKGAEVGAIPAIYHIWHDREKSRLDLLPARDRLIALNGMKPSDVELAAENASLKQQLDYVQRQPHSKIAQGGEHQGTVAQRTHAQAI